MGGGFVVSPKDEIRFHHLQEFISGKHSRADTAKLLGISERAVSKAARRVRAQGLRGAIHGNKKRAPANQIDKFTKQRVISLKKDTYAHFNVRHAQEKLAEDEGIHISYSTLLRWCKAESLTKFKQKRRRKLRKLRERYSQEGYFMMMDGSPHAWFGNEKSCLISIIDDATSDIPAAEFWPTETTAGCLSVLKILIEKKGRPAFIYVDKAGIYGGQKRQEFSHFETACTQLGISLLYANSPQAKGRIERSYRTFQDRLVAEMELAKISTIGQANEFLRNFLETHWKKKFTVPATDSVIWYRSLEEHQDAKQICSIKITREIRNDSAISFENVIYVLSAKKGEPLLAARVAEVRIYPDNTWAVYAEGRKMELYVASGNRQPDPRYRHKIRPGNLDVFIKPKENLKAG